MMKTKEIESFNFYKAFACCLIAFIHCRFPGYLGNVIRTIAKCGVPFFFMVSGYFFLYGKEHLYIESKAKNKIKHVLIIVVFTTLFYIGYTLFLYRIVYQQELDIRNLLAAFNVTKLILANSPLIYSHLWFLGALLYCYLFALMMKEKMQGNWKQPIIIAGLLSFTIMSEIMPRFGVKPMVAGIPIYNIFAFRALPFFLLGIVLREKEKQIIEKAEHLQKSTIIVIALTGFFISLIERILLVESQFYVGTYIAVLAIFILCMTYPQGYNIRIQYIGKEFSLYVYVIHIAVMKIGDLYSWGGGVAGVCKTAHCCRSVFDIGTNYFSNKKVWKQYFEDNFCQVIDIE